ncbi:HEPN/Toprim-associated domain-containing protein [Cupriavidus sp. 8B]
MLFQERDRQRRRHPHINYDYYEQHPEEDVAQSEMCFCRALGSMVSRLELLGYTLSAVKADYEIHSALDSDRYAGSEADGMPARPDRFTFEQFITFIRAQR